MQQKTKVVIIILLFCILIGAPVYAQDSDVKEEQQDANLSFEYKEFRGRKNAAEIVKKIVGSFKKVKDFKGSLVSKVFLDGETVTYQTNLMKNQQRSLIDNSYNFGKIKGTEVGRLLNALPWIYLPPDYSLLQSGLPLSGQRNYLKPLANLKEIYSLKLIGEARLHNKPMYLLELDNSFARQILWIEKEELIINKIEIFNGADNLVAVINYSGYRELVNDIWLPNSIVVKTKNDEKVLEVNYQNWVLNSNLNNQDFAIGFASQARQEIAKLEEVVVNNPDDSESRYKLAKLYYQVLETKKAIKTLKEAIKIEEKIKYYQKLAEIYREQSKYNQAIDMVKKALVLDYQNSELHFILGELYLQLQKIDEARSSFETAVNLNPTNEKYLGRLFWTYRRSAVTDTMLKNAQNTLDKLINLAPQKPEYHIYSGDLYLQAKRYIKAAHRYQKAIQIASEDTWGYLKLARCYEEMNKYQLAEKLYKEAIKIETSWLNYEKLGDFYYRWKDYESSIENYKLALQMKPQQFELRIKLGKVHWALKNEDKALEIWGKILENESLRLDDYIKLGELFTDYELNNLAVATYKQGIKEFANETDSWSKKLVAKLHANLAELYKEQNNYELAVKEYETSLKLYTYTWVYKDLGILKLRNGDLTTAVELWKKAKKEDVGEMKVIYDLAIAQIIAGRYEQATANLEYIKRFNPGKELNNLINKGIGVIKQLKQLEKKEDNSAYGREYKLEGDKLRQEGQLNLAIEKYHKALEKNSYYGDVYLYLGLIQSAKQNYQRVNEIITNFDNDYFQKDKAKILQKIRDLTGEVE